MKKATFCTFLFLFFVCQLGFSQGRSSFQSMDVFELEWVEKPKISPDGQSIVYVRRGMDIMTDKKSSRLWMIDIDGGNHQKLSSHDFNESNPTWSPDGKQIAFTGSTDEGTELFVYWTGSSKVAKLSSLENSPSGISWSPDGKQIAFSMFVDGEELSLVKEPKKPKGAKWADAPRVTTRFKHEADGVGKLKPGFSHLFVMPSEGGSPRQISAGDFNHKGPLVWSKDGQEVYFSGNRNEDCVYDFRNSEIYAASTSTGKIRALTERKGPDHHMALSPNGKQLAYVGYDDKTQTFQNTRLYVMDVDGSGETCLTAKLDESISNPVWDKNGQGIYYMVDIHGNTRIKYLSIKTQLSQEIAKDLGGTGMGRPYGGGSFSVSDNGSIAYTHTTPSHPSELAVLTPSSKSVRLIHPLNNDILGRRQLATVEEIWYKSSVDGRDVQGWIAKPPGFQSRNSYPLLVENHGGPISNYGDRFSPEIQLYASAGFVVFYPNPRGSTSYGEEFANLLYHNYPGEDYDDVMDGVDAILKMGYVSEDSLFVTGGSAGGIMTSWMIGKNNRFRSAAVIKPVMNWISKTLTADNYYGYAHSRYPGQPWENFEDYWKFSPISLVGNIETPTLVMVGTSDMRTPLSEAKQLYHALKIRKIETALVEVPGAYHFISNRPSQLITKIEHIVAWFNRYR